MRVVFLNPTGQLGGAERSLLDMLAGLRAAEPGWELRLILASDGPLLAKAKALGVPCEVLPLPPSLGAAGDWAQGPRARLALALRLLAGAAPACVYLRRLSALLRSLSPDIIHSNGLKTHVLAARARPPGTPLVWHLHDYVSRRPVISRLLRWSIGPRLRVIANSRSVAQDAQAALGMRARVVYNAVDLDRFSPRGPALDLDALSGLPGAPAGTVRIGLLATFARWKGHEVFLRALARLPGTLGFRGYIVGAPVYQTEGSQYRAQELRALAVSLGLEGRMGFTGFVDEPAAALRALDIVAHASTSPEPFGLAVAEAMACGKALVTTGSGGVAELIAPGEDALTAPPGQAAALAERLRELAQDSALRARLGDEARRTAKRRFDRQRVAAQVLEAYRGFTPAARPAPRESP